MTVAGSSDERMCLCADPENCTQRVPGYRCKRDFMGVGQGADATKAATEPVRRPDSLPSKTLVEEIMQKADNAYCEGLRLAEQSLCLGADWKMTHGEFTRENLDAHIASAKQDAWHRALYWSVRLIRERAAHETRTEPAAVLKWAVDSFGSIALNRDERAARMAEEAIEVAQVEGVPLEVMQRITARVYSRPVGELGQEIGGLVLGLYALAANAGVDIDAEFKREFDRVLSKPRDWWTRKHAEKVAAGTADLSPRGELKASEAPPVDNDHVADGCEKFDV